MNLDDEAGVVRVVVQSILGLWEVVTVPRCVADVDAAIAIVREYHAKWLDEQARAAEPRTAGT